MWRVLVFALGLIISGLFAAGGAQNASASAPLWVTNPPLKIAEVPDEAASSDDKSCGARLGVINIIGEDEPINACVYGESSGTRLARYRTGSTEYAYAIAFLTDGSFVPIQGLCTGLARCVYGQAGDVLLLHMPTSQSIYKYAVIKDFSKYLQRVSDHFKFEYPHAYTYFAAGGNSIEVSSSSVSLNGRWGVISTSHFGLIRIDFKTLSYKRIALNSSLPTNNSHPMELTISNDGEWVVAIGDGSSQPLYRVTDTCGDVLVTSSTSQFPQGATACSYTIINLNNMVAGYISAHIPRFSTDSHKLVLNIQTQTRALVVTLVSKPPDSGNPYYLAFGDSYTSGEGELDDSFYINSTNTSTNRCHVSSRSYPYLLSWHWDINTLSLACSGSRIPNITEAARNFKLSGLSRQPTVLSIGVGGNDVDLVGKLKNCIGVGTCDLAKMRNRVAASNEIKELFPKIVTLITNLKLEFSPASLFVVGYPSVVNDIADAECSLLIGSMLTWEEREYISESIKYVNKILNAAANYTKTPFVDIETTYFGERLCDQKETAMNGVRTGDDIAPIPTLSDLKLIGAESFHPTPRGHQLGALSIRSQLDAKLFWSTNGCSGCYFSASQVEPSQYWEGEQGVGVGVLEERQLSSTFLGSEIVNSVSDVAFNFLSNTFTPNSSVSFELHSDIKQLGIYTVRSDGSLRGVLTLPGDTKGYHTIHAYGNSRSGEKIDMYQTVYIGDEIAYESISLPADDTDTPTSPEVDGEDESVTPAPTQLPQSPVVASGTNEHSYKPEVISPNVAVGTLPLNHSTTDTIIENKKPEHEKSNVYLVGFGLIVLSMATLFIRRKIKT